jgi:integrase
LEVWTVPARSHRTPSYRLHKATGQAVVTIARRDVYLGKHGTPESRAEYDRLIAEWLTNGRRPPEATTPDGPSLTVCQLLVDYVKWADGYYVKNGKRTTEPVNIRLALRPLNRLYGHTPARDFSPLGLKAVRSSMIESDLCRNEVNKRVRHIIRAFKWGVENELVPPSTLHGLKAVSGLRKGRTEARESEPVKPVPEAFVDAIRPHVNRRVWAMIETQRLTGMRPGEVCIMRTCDLEMSGRVWTYHPETHKTEHHGKERLIFLGPRTQELIRPWLRTDLTAFLFSPAEALEEHYAARRQGRKSPMTPSQQARRRVTLRKRPPGEHYTSMSYLRAITTACKKANIPTWHPHQLRHNAATRLRKEFGLDVASAVLGHASLAVTDGYAELNAEKARLAMERVG